MRQLIAAFCVAAFTAVPAIAATDSKDSLNGFKETKIPTKQGFETMDMNQFQGIDQGQRPPNSRITFQTSCKDENGSEVQQTDVSYESCLHQAAEKAKLRADGKTGVEMGFKVGN